MSFHGTADAANLSIDFENLWQLSVNDEFQIWLDPNPKK